MKNSIAQLIETALQRYLALDPRSVERLRALQNHSVVIEFKNFDVAMQIFFISEKNIRVSVIDINQHEPASAIIKGTPLQLLQVSLTQKNRQTFFAEDVVMEGDAAIAQQVMHLFDEMDIDWEEHLSHWTGDVAAHHLGNAARGVRNFLKRVKETVSQSTNEYVHEEVNFFPTREALQDFFNDVDQLRMDADRLEVRIKKMRAEN